MNKDDADDDYIPFKGTPRPLTPAKIKAIKDAYFKHRQDAPQKADDELTPLQKRMQSGGA